MTTDRETLDKLGRFLMSNLRDSGIDFIDGLAEGRWKAPVLLPLQADVVALPEETRRLMRRAFVAGIDGAIHDFLFKLTETADFEQDIQLVVDGRDVVPLSDGLHGEPFGEDGWQARFSRYGEVEEP
jgi:hypothetical protein